MTSRVGPAVVAVAAAALAVACSENFQSPTVATPLGGVPGLQSADPVSPQNGTKEPRLPVCHFTGTGAGAGTWRLINVAQSAYDNAHMKTHDDADPGSVTRLTGIQLDSTCTPSAPAVPVPSGCPCDFSPPADLSLYTRTSPLSNACTVTSSGSTLSYSDLDGRPNISLSASPSGSCYAVMTDSAGTSERNQFYSAALTAEEYAACSADLQTAAASLGISCFIWP